MITIEYLVILILFLSIILIRKKQSKPVETFINSNFNICDERDCKCLKMHTAPDGTCTDKKIPNIPNIPESDVYTVHL